MGESESFRDEIEGQLKDIPRWGCVAFAARCARRVQPLFVKSWPDAPQEHIDAIEKAIDLAELMAADPSVRNRGAADTGANAAAAARAAANAKANARTAHAAAYAANAAVAYTDVADVADAAARAAAYAAYAAYAYADVAFADDLGNNIRNDVQALQAAHEKGLIDENGSVPQSLFGPLWPDGAPEWWPDADVTSENHRIKLKFRLPANASEETIQEHVIEAIKDINGLHRLAGGHGLQVEEVEVQQPIAVKEPV